jgi:hypothetical protein
VYSTAIKHHSQQPLVVTNVSCRSIGTKGPCIIHDRHAFVAFIVGKLTLHIVSQFLLADFVIVAACLCYCWLAVVVAAC